MNDASRFRVIQFRWIRVLIVSGIFAVCGVSMLFMTRAAGPVMNIEAELGVLTARAQVFQDQSASGGSYIAFAPPLGAASPSGQSMPTGDLPGWRMIFSDDFTLDAPVGSWGSQCDHQQIAYTGAAGTQWLSYPSCFYDTYQSRPYRADQVLSVRDGVLNFHLHTVDGQPAGANPSPIIKNGSQYQTYGRYAARFRVLNASDLSNYYVAWLLWPQSERWVAGGPGDGEIDFPEGHLNGTVGGFHHCLYDNAVNCGWASTGGARFSDWHTYIIEWTPDYVRFILNDQVVMDYTDRSQIPDTPMRWQLQTETNTNNPNNAAGNLEVDWVAVWEMM